MSYAENTASHCYESKVSPHAQQFGYLSKILVPERYLLHFNSQSVSLLVLPFNEAVFRVGLDLLEVLVHDLLAVHDVLLWYTVHELYILKLLYRICCMSVLFNDHFYIEVFSVE